MLKVGLTGGIGSGKSVVSKVFELLGIPVYVADVEAKRLMNSDSEIRSKLIAKFGSQVYDLNNNLNRKFLADIIFKQPEALQEVNAIVHPVVRKDFERWMVDCVDSPYVVQESAILFDTGLYQFFDKIITVTADEEVRIKRVMQRDSVSKEMVLDRMKNQLPEWSKIQRSDFVIYNNLELVLPQIIKIDREIRKLAAE